MPNSKPELGIFARKRGRNSFLPDAVGLGQVQDAVGPVGVSLELVHPGGVGAGGDQQAGVLLPAQDVAGSW